MLPLKGGITNIVINNIYMYYEFLKCSTQSSAYVVVDFLKSLFCFFFIAQNIYIHRARWD